MWPKRTMAKILDCIADELEAKHGHDLRLFVTDLRIASKSMERKDVVLREALEALLNMAPRIRDERGGCFGNGGQDCNCTACRIRREIG